MLVTTRPHNAKPSVSTLVLLLYKYTHYKIASFSIQMNYFSIVLSRVKKSYVYENIIFNVFWAFHIVNFPVTQFVIYSFYFFWSAHHLPKQAKSFFNLPVCFLFDFWISSLLVTSMRISFSSLILYLKFDITISLEKISSLITLLALQFCKSPILRRSLANY